MSNRLGEFSILRINIRRRIKTILSRWSLNGDTLLLFEIIKYQVRNTKEVIPLPRYYLKQIRMPKLQDLELMVLESAKAEQTRDLIQSRRHNVENYRLASRAIVNRNGLFFLSVISLFSRITITRKTLNFVKKL